MRTVNRNWDPMTEDQKRALSTRGQECRPVGWARGSRRDALRQRRKARAA
jgi:hypothetical protein